VLLQVNIRHVNNKRFYTSAVKKCLVVLYKIYRFSIKTVLYFLSTLLIKEIINNTVQGFNKKLP